MDCAEDFCRPCFSSQHRRGKRAEHRVQALLGELMAAPEQLPEPDVEGVGMILAAASTLEGEEEDDDEAAMAIESELDDRSQAEGGGGGGGGGEEGVGGVEGGICQESYERLKMTALDYFTEAYRATYMENARYTPMRLTAQERRLLGVLESALRVSEYTDNVDTVSRKSKQLRIVEELEHLFATILGLMICSEPVKGIELVGKDVAENGEFFQTIFEIGRRYKIMNPVRRVFLSSTHPPTPPTDPLSLFDRKRCGARTASSCTCCKTPRTASSRYVGPHPPTNPTHPNPPNHPSIATGRLLLRQGDRDRHLFFGGTGRAGPAGGRPDPHCLPGHHGQRGTSSQPPTLPWSPPTHPLSPTYRARKRGKR